ncbi:MAG TPA: LCP family protein [Pseudoclavibacter sp.]|nr:LCP family protein [Pseudoclavibacter sp.]
MSDPGTLRRPNEAESRVMSRRGWWLVVLNFLVPGLPQLVAGNRVLARIVLWFWALSWVAGLWALWALLAARSTFASVFSNSAVLWVLQGWIILGIVILVVLSVDTLRLVRVVRTRGRTRLLLPLAMLVVGALAVSGLTWASSQVSTARGLLEDVFGDGVVAEPVDGRYNILLLGGDSGEGRIGLRPDSLSVVSVDASTGQTAIIGVPRNMEQVPFPEGSPMLEIYPDGYTCGSECMVNALYTEGEAHPELYPDAEEEGSSPGIEATKDGVEGITGLTIQYFVLVNMEGFIELIDALGGITVDVPESVELVDGSDDDLQYHGTIEAGEQHMDGQTALWYARSRKTTSDYDRMERQRLIEKAIIAQFSPSVIVSKFQEVAQATSATLQTDIPQVLVSTMVDLAEGMQSYDVQSLELTPDNGIVTADPDYATIHAMVAETVAAATTPAE